MSGKFEQSNCSELPELVDATPENARFGYMLTVLSLCYFGFFLVWFALRQRYSEYLQKRSFGLIFCSTLASVFLFIPAWREHLGRNDFPCILLDLFPQMIAFMVLFHNARIYRLIVRIQFNRVLAKTSYKKVSDETKLNTGAPPVIHQTNSISSRSRDSEVDNSMTKNSNFNLSFGKGGWGWSNLDTLVFLQSFRFQLMLLGLFTFVIFLSVWTSVRWDISSCRNCPPKMENHVFILVVIFLLVLSLLRALWYIRKEPDVLGLYDELYYSSVVFIGLAVISLMFGIPDTGGVYSDGKFTWSYLLCFGALISFTLIAPKQIFRSYFMESFDDEVNHLGLSAILNSEIGINYFKIHMINELSIESILFWQNAMAWKNAYRTTSVLIREENYIRIFKTFIEHGSIMQINISYDTYENVLRDADRSKNIPETVFDECMTQAVYLMSSNAYPRFLRSELYQRYLSAARGESGGILENQGYL